MARSWHRHLGEASLATIAIVHERLATSMLLFMFSVGLWGLVSFLRGGSLSGSVAGALVIGQCLVLIQAFTGAVLYAGNSARPSSVHYLYGLTAILVLPFAWSYLRSRDQRQALLFYSMVALFIGGLAIRGMATGH